jgi:hypothetical protein
MTARCNRWKWMTAVLVCCLAMPIAAKERVEHFDRDPSWEGHNNRAENSKARPVRQDFGYSRTTHTGGQAGEIGGLITAAAEAAYYGKRLEPKTFADSLTASGRLVCKGRQFHVLVAFFNADTVNEWRTPNTVAIRLLGRGDMFYAYVEYATQRWRAGGDNPGGFATVRDPKTGKLHPRGFAAGQVHRWSLRYDPKGNDGGGSVTAMVDDETAVCNLATGHKADGAAFNRFGLLPVLKSADGSGEVWLGDVTINGQN